MKRVGKWLAETPAGRTAFRLSVLALATLCVGGAVFAIIVNFQQDQKITRVEHSACQADPDGRECQQTKLEAAKAASIYVTCVPFWKAGYPCPKPGSAAAKRRERREVGNPKAVQGLETGPKPAAKEQPTSPPRPEQQHVGSGKSKAPHHKTSEPAQVEPPISAPTETAPSAASPDEDAGNSGDTPAAESANGLKACVDLAVSACVGAGIDSPAAGSGERRGSE